VNRAAVATLAAWLALVSASAAIVARSGLSTDLQAFLPSAPAPAQQLLVDQLRDGLVSRLMLIAIAGEEPRVLADLSRGVAERLADAPEFADVNNGSEDVWQAHRAFLIEHRYLLSPAVGEGHFSAENLRRALQAQLRLLSSSIGALTAPLVSSDPTGEFLSIVEKLESKRRPDMRHGVWFDAAGNRALLVAQTISPGFEIDAQQAAVNRIVAAFRDTQAAAGETAAELIVVGPGVFATQVRDAIKADAIRVTTAAALAIAALLLFVMRSVRALALILVPVGSGALVGIAACLAVLGFSGAGTAGTVFHLRTRRCSRSDTLGCATVDAARFQCSRHPALGGRIAPDRAEPAKGGYPVAVRRIGLRGLVAEQGRRAMER
jgi:predicted exporter